MSQRIMISIPDELYRRISDELSAGQTVQDYTMAAIRNAVYGSPVEAELRRQIADLHDTLRSLRGGGGGDLQTVDEGPYERARHQIEARATRATTPAPDTRKGW